VSGPALGRPGAVPVAIIDTASGRELKRLAGHDEAVDFVSFADDPILVTGGKDHLFRVWDLQTGLEIRQIPRVGHYYPKVEAVSSDGRYLACVDRNDVWKQPLHVFEISTGRELLHIVIPTSAWSLAFAPDCRSLVCMGPTTYRFEIPSGKPSGTWTGADSWHKLTCSNKGPLTLARVEGQLRAFDFVSGKPAEFPLPLPVCIGDQSTPTDLWVTGSGSRLEVWDLKTGKPRHPTVGHTRTILGVALSTDGQAITADLNCIRRWDALGRERQMVRCRSTFATYIAALSPDGRTFANGDAGGTVRFWDATSGQELPSIGQPVSVSSSLVFDPTKNRLAVTAGPTVKVWDLSARRESGNLVSSKKQFGSTKAAFSPDGQVLYAGDESGSIREWDLVTGTMMRELEGHPELMDQPRLGAIRRIEPHTGHMNGVLNLSVTSDGRRVVSAGWEGTLRIWEIATGKECGLLQRIDSMHDLDYQRTTFPMVISPDGALLAMPGQESDRHQLIDLWDIRSGRRFSSLAGHRGPVTALAFSPDGHRLISGSMDTLAYIWELPQLKQDSPVAIGEARAAALWRDLGDADPVKAYRALGVWLAAPESAISFFRRFFVSIKSVDTEAVRRLIAGLDSNQYAVRENASNELRALGSGIREHLRRALKASPSFEAARRIDRVLAELPDLELQARRAIEVLEAIGTPAARTLLKEWAAGNPDSVVAREVAAALKRMGQQ
jgi:WD40 repeat protein